jgi:RNA polymerase sigma-70 factor (ECF subfamily)
VLCDVEGLSYQEIADIMDAKLGTVRSRIHRGRAMLREALAHRAPTAGRERYAGPVVAPQGPVVTGGLSAGPA